MSCAAEYIPEIHARGFRMTPQRMAIMHVLRHAGGHLSPIQVFKLARKDLPTLTETTVYRTLEFLAGQGFVLTAHLGNGKLAYELAQGNHHHLVCRNCGRTVKIEHAPLGRLYRQLESSTGYRLDSTHVTLFGLCPDCQNSIN